MTLKAFTRFFLNQQITHKKFNGINIKQPSLYAGGAENFAFESAKLKYRRRNSLAESLTDSTSWKRHNIYLQRL